MSITASEQPDLFAIPDFYQCGQGVFLIAQNCGRIVGTIALKDIGDDQAALRKMFVAAPFRGAQMGVAAGLLDTLLDHAAQAGVRDIFLGTADRLRAAHRFYEKNGFSAVGEQMLPARFPRMAVDTRFYHRSLAQHRTNANETA